MNIIPSLNNIKFRSKILKNTRSFFENNNYIEVDTCTLRKTAATDPYIDSFHTQNIDHQTLYLQSSPEYALKILLGYYQLPIFEITKAYRNEQNSPLHLQEFTLLEWYKPNANYLDLIRETQQLIQFIASQTQCTHFFPSTYKIPIHKNFETITVQEAFLKFTGFNPLTLSQNELATAANDIGTIVNPQWPWDDIFTCLLIDKIEPNIGYNAPTFLIDYPPSQASLAKLRNDSIPVAERFELYIAGVELCNGYSELTNPHEQHTRFIKDLEIRKTLSLPQLPIDHELINALKNLNTLAGNALGFDRLLLTLQGENDIRQCTFTL